MRAEGPLMRGTLIRRYQRFLMDVRTPEGDLWTVHCPNSGSMEGCLAEGAEVVCSRSPNPGRKLPWTAEWIRLPGLRDAARERGRRPMPSSPPRR